MLANNTGIFVGYLAGKYPEKRHYALDKAKS